MQKVSQELAVNLPVPNQMEPHEVRRAGLGGCASYDADDLFGGDEAAGFENAFGGFDELVGADEAVALDGVGAPEKHRAVHDGLVG